LIISEKAKKELLDSSHSESLRRDMQKLSIQRHGCFLKEGRADSDAYIEFLNHFNSFINHLQKPFKRIIENEMKL